MIWAPFVLRQAPQSAWPPSWWAEHGRLATAALVEWLGRKQTAAPAARKVEIVQARWPHPVDLLQNTPPADRHRITRSAEFVRGYPYSGWTKGVYPVCSFDAYSTEFRLAERFEASGAAVRGWVRITQTVPLTIAYQSGAGTRTYVPDFVVVVVVVVVVHWIVEGKRDDEMTDDVVLAKRDAAADWVKTVNAHEDVHQTWAYLLAPETVVKERRRLGRAQGRRADVPLTPSACVPPDVS